MITSAPSGGFAPMPMDLGLSSADAPNAEARQAEEYQQSHPAGTGDREPASDLPGRGSNDPV